MTILHRVKIEKAASGDPLEFVLSDETVDRYGDIIKADGWILKNFKKNPIALFNHSSNFPIGHWDNVRVEGKKLIGKLVLATKGTSDRIDEIINLVEQGILRAVSVGFQPTAAPDEGKNGGYIFTKQELLETSLVSIPANPAAVQLARSMKVSDETIDLVFGEKATVDRKPLVRAGISGEQAILKSTETIISHAQRKFVEAIGKKPTMSIAKQIEERSKALAEYQDQLNAKAAELETSDDVDACTLAIDELNGKIESVTKQLDSLKRAEASLANNTVHVAMRDTDGHAVVNGGENNRRPWAAPAKKVNPFDYFLRSAVISAVAHVTRQNPVDVLKERYGEDRITKGVFDIVCRAASAPALTTTTGWAAELVQTAFLDMIDTLMPESVYPGLAARGGKFTFGRNGVVSIPARSTATTIAGSFVGQGAPIPVRQGAFTATTLTPKKMAVITAFSREMAEHSTPAIEAVLRQAIVEDTSVAIDTVLLDATAASAIRPAGLRNGVTGATATAGGGLAALVADVKALAGSLITSTNGHLRAPVWIMNPAQVLSIQFQTNANGQFIFADEIGRGTFRGYPLLVSTSVPAATVLLVDAADFFSATGDVPNFNVSDQATLHMEDTTPLAIGTTGAPATVAAPARSLFQTDSLAIRMTMDLNWALRRAGVVAFVATVTW